LFTGITAEPGRLLYIFFDNLSKKNPLFCIAFGVLYSFISPERFDNKVKCSLVTVYC